MSYKIVEVRFLGTNDKTYMFITKLNLNLDEWYNIYTKESGGYNSPIKVVKLYPLNHLNHLYDVCIYKEIIRAEQIALHTKMDKTRTSISIDSSYPKDGYIDRVWFNPVKGTTVVRWVDGSKTMVRCQKGETFDKEKGLALCYMKRTLGNKSSFNEILKKWCYDETEKIEEHKVENMKEEVNKTKANLNPKEKKNEYYIGEIDLESLISHLFSCNKGE